MRIKKKPDSKLGGSWIFTIGGVYTIDGTGLLGLGSFINFPNKKPTEVGFDSKY